MKAPRYLMLAAAIFLLSVPPLLAGEKAGAKGKKEIITLASELQVGSMRLDPGTYEVQHVFAGSDHYMVFRKARRNSYGAIDSVGKEVTREKCTMKSLGEKVENTQVIQAGGRLKELRVRGEDVTHLF